MYYFDNISDNKYLGKPSEEELTAGFNHIWLTFSQGSCVFSKRIVSSLPTELTCSFLGSGGRGEEEAALSDVQLRWSAGPDLLR